MTLLILAEEQDFLEEYLMCILFLNIYHFPKGFPGSTGKWKWKSLSCVRLCNLMDYIVHGILQDTILEWVAFPFSRASSQPRNGARVSCIAGGFFTNWAIREALIVRMVKKKKKKICIPMQEMPGTWVQSLCREVPLE